MAQPFLFHIFFIYLQLKIITMLKEYEYYLANDDNKEIIGLICGYSLINVSIMLSQFKLLCYREFIKLYKVVEVVNNPR